MRYTQWFNLLGGPAAVVPVSRSAEGLPIGVQIAGRPFADELVLAVAAAVESEFGYQAAAAGSLSRKPHGIRALQPQEKQKVRVSADLSFDLKRLCYGLRREKRFSLETSFTMMKAKNRISMTNAT